MRCNYFHHFLYSAVILCVAYRTYLFWRSVLIFFRIIIHLLLFFYRSTITMQPSHGTKRRKCLRKIAVAKRPVNLFRNSSIYSQSSTKTEATEVEKCLSFDGNVRVCYTIARSDFSLEEKTATWYATEEYTRISEQCSRQIYKMDEGKVLKDRKYCSRGLEQHTRRGRAIKIQNRSSSIQAVLMEQEKQSDEGTYDDVVISRVYRGVTSSCQLWANVVGVRDQRVAEDYLDDINLQMPQTITKEPEQQSKPSIFRRRTRPRRNVVAARIA